MMAISIRTFKLASMILLATGAFAPMVLADEALAPKEVIDNAKKTDAEITVITPTAADKDAPAVVPAKADIKPAKETQEKKFRGNAPCMTWISPDASPKAVILCIHGLGLHNDSYEDFGQTLSKRGIAVYAIDVRGFGSWMDAKGRETVDFQGCLEDVEKTLKSIHRAHPGLNVFLLGESMGGAIALRATALYPQLVSGLISSVPAGDRFQQGKTALKVALHLLDSPNKPFDVGSGVIKQATTNAELQESWKNDPLNRLKLSANELLQFQNFMNQNHDSAAQVSNTPVLIVQGCQDRLVKPEGTVELYNELPVKDKQLVLVHNSEHLIFEEHQFNEQVIDLLTKWIDEHLSKKTAPAKTSSIQPKKQALSVSKMPKSKSTASKTSPNF
jgi:acylglycerol lipase